jgi:opacity protein-like surface antigen
MRSVLIAAVSLAAFASSASAAQRHVWFAVDYANGRCAPAPMTPEQFYLISNEMAAQTGTTVDRIAPENVEKDSQGNIHVSVTGMSHGEPSNWEFFTSKAACEKFITDKGISPEQAPNGDIN